MKLVTFQASNGKEHVGIRVENKNKEGMILDLTSEDPQTFPDMLTLIRHQDQALPKARAFLQKHDKGDFPSNLLSPEKDTHLLSPIPRPVSMRDGYAFRQHVEAARRNRGVPMIPEFDDFPIFYFTNHLAVTGPGDVVVQERHLEKLDYELEIGIVTGREGINVPANKADELIFGYMIMNDWSARALQMQEMKLNLGPAKGKDFATSLGPYLVPREDLASFAHKTPHGEKHDLKMTCSVNGKQLSAGNLKDISWTFAQILERISYGTKVHPGEVIGSGTVGTGCLLELNGSKITDNLWIKDGDEVTMTVDELGTLTNKIVLRK